MLYRSTWFEKKNSSSVDIFILNNSSDKKVVFPKSKEPPIVKKWSLGRSFAPKKQEF